MVKLVAMSEDEYQHFIAWAIEDYAREQVKAGAWPEENAPALAKHAFESRLPEGLSTPNQFLYMIEREADGVKVGQLWWGIQEQGENQFATLNDFHVFPEFRRQGLGVQAMDAMEAMMRQNGLDTVYLHVFGHNEPARALYRKLGYVERNITMMKGL
ncbi:GNAT family N-acetyltransferase [Candidatus Leptofilum sp.]|uniref:GNAT family N-acetyltransferase n=1 Tax=Candidatus Leptofilum sp. TaxID=3241576 RepID=UPI003B5A9FF3